MALKDDLNVLAVPDVINLKVNAMDAENLKNKYSFAIMYEFYGHVTDPDKENKTPMVQKISGSISGDPGNLGRVGEGKLKNDSHGDACVLWFLISCKF